MKTKLVFSLLCWLVSSLAAYSQGRGFRDFIIAASSPTNPRASEASFSLAGGKDRFELDQWGMGWALSQSGEKVKDGYGFNFDYLTNELYLRKDEEDLMMVMDYTSVNSFVIFNGKDSVRFVKNPIIDKSLSMFFIQLSGDLSSNWSLLKLRTAKEVVVDKNDYARNFNGDYTQKYKSSSKYYLIDDKQKPYEFVKISKEELLTVFPQHKESILRHTADSKKVLSEKVLISWIDELNTAK